MSGIVLAAVLGSAVLHGTWNAIAKAIPDRLVSSTLIGLAYLVIGGIGCLLLPLPSPASWPAIGLSTVIQTTYLILLTAAYAKTEFSTAYPLTRGASVIGITLVSVLLLGEQLTALQLGGICVVAGALLALAFARTRASAAGPGGGSAVNSPGTARAGLLLVLAVAVAITCYSVIDGVGVRVSESPLAYACWLFFLQGITIPLVCVVLARGRRRRLVAGLRSHAPLGLLGGALSLVSYAIIVWAQSVAPLALVSALRETGVLAAGLIGLVVFKERLSQVGMVATVAAVAGIVAIRAGA